MTPGIIGLARAKCVRCGHLVFARDRPTAAELLADHLREVHGPWKRFWRES